MKYFWLIAGDTLWRDDWNAIVRAKDLTHALALVRSGSDSVWYSVVASREIHESYVDLERSDANLNCTGHEAILELF